MSTVDENEGDGNEEHGTEGKQHSLNEMNQLADYATQEVYKIYSCCNSINISEWKVSYTS